MGATRRGSRSQNSHLPQLSQDDSDTRFHEIPRDSTSIVKGRSCRQNAISVPPLPISKMTHRLSCTTIRCPGCCQTFSSSVYLDHIALCEVRRCYRCFQPKIPQSEMA